jgi:hypothetical protein
MKSSCMPVAPPKLLHWPRRKEAISREWLRYVWRFGGDTDTHSGTPDLPVLPKGTVTDRLISGHGIENECFRLFRPAKCV